MYTQLILYTAIISTTEGWLGDSLIPRLHVLSKVETCSPGTRLGLQ